MSNYPLSREERECLDKFRAIPRAVKVYPHDAQKIAAVIDRLIMLNLLCQERHVEKETGDAP